MYHWGQRLHTGTAAPALIQLGDTTVLTGLHNKNKYNKQRERETHRQTDRHCRITSLSHTVIYFSCLFYPLGGTAVGTGLNAHKGFAEKVAASIAEYTGKSGKS